MGSQAEQKAANRTVEKTLRDVKTEVATVLLLLAFGAIAIPMFIILLIAVAAIGVGVGA